MLITANTDEADLVVVEPTRRLWRDDDRVGGLQADLRRRGRAEQILAG